MVLGGYPIIGDPIFTKLQDKEMREVEKKLILARQKPWQSKKGKATTSKWINIFVGKGSEIEHEAFLATWLSIIVFPHKYLLKKSLFPIAILLARGYPIALAPAVLASIYKDLSLFKKTIVDLSKYPVGGDRFPLEITLQSPFYLVQIWVWERFKNLQPEPQTMLINHGDPFLFRWHKVKDLPIDNVRIALDSAGDDFLWRPYVRYADKCAVFYPNDEISVPLKIDLDNKMLSFVICLRCSELVGIDSIEQYLPHRVAMQFGMDQDVPSYVPRFNKTKVIAWKNYCRLISDKILYFPPRLFEADVTTRYVKWWKQFVLGRDDFVNNIVHRKRSSSWRKHRPHVGKFNRSGIDAGVPPGFPPNLDDFYANVPYENSVHESLRADKSIDADAPSSLPPKHKTLVPSKSVDDCSASSADYEKMLPLKRPISKDNNEVSIGDFEDEDANASKRARICTDRVSLSSPEFVDLISSDVGSEIAGCVEEITMSMPSMRVLIF